MTMSEFEDQHKKVKPLDDQADWVMSFVDDSRQARSSMDAVWSETEQNFLVRPMDDISLGSSTRHPLQSSLSDVSTPRSRALSVLKDPETHQQVMTIVSKVGLALLPQDDSFVEAIGVGFEDIHKASTVNKLEEYVFRLPNHFVVFIEWLMSQGIYGTGIMQGFWHFQEELRNQRDIIFDEYIGETSIVRPMMTATYDDPKLILVDVRDFYPDAGNTRMSDMMGAATRFKIGAAEAFRRAARGQYKMEAVKRAVERQMSMDAEETKDHPDGEDATSMSGRRESHPDFAQLIGYEFYGEAPFKAAKGDAGFEDGITRRVITVLCGETVRSDPWPRRLPFFDGRVLPRLNSFWGIAPAEIIRYDQDFADTLKMMLADAVVRMTHPPILYDKDADMDLAKLRAFRPRVPIGARFRGSAPVEMLRYSPPLNDAFAMYSGVKGQMREASGALGAIQGLGLGSKRYSASEAVQTFQQALDRPEMFAQVVEREYLPPIGKYILELYQEFMPDGEEGALELQRRVGQSEIPVSLSDIMPEFDIKFVGSRVEGGNQRKLEAFREIVTASANPTVAQLIPWIPLLRKWFRSLGAHDVAAMVGNQEVMALNMMLTQLGGQNALAGNNNGTVPKAPPSGLLPSQVSGNLA